MHAHQMNLEAMNRILLVTLLCSVATASFFGFLKSASSKQERVIQHVDTNLVRGVPERLHAKYLGDRFVCDGKSHSSAIVNDGFCDCIDKSDEPGTSACDGSVFHCINKGYKMIKIASSRVDDQVCDCCDGSDEGRVAQCANTCDEAAQRERAQLTKVTNNYKAGSSIREELITTVKREKAQLAASVTPLGMEVHRLKEDVDAVQARLDQKLERLKSIEASVGNQQRAELRSWLMLNRFDFVNLAHFLSNLLKTLKVPSHSLVDTVSAPAGAAASVAISDRAGDEHDHHDAEDRYGDEEEPEIVYESLDTESVSIDGEVEPADSPAESEPAADSSGCVLVDLTGDTFLQQLCNTITNEQAAIDALLNVILKRQAYTHAMLLLGHHQLHQSFIGADAFALGHIDSNLDACPAIFEAIPADHNGAVHCALKDTLKHTVDAVEAHYGLPDARAEVESLRTQVRELNNKIRDVESKLSTARGANDEVAKYAEYLEYLALKDQCFEKEDGAFLYTLCVLGKVKQKELHGHREVTLGVFDHFEPGYDSAAVDGVVPSVVMKFGKGDHCHAFGARTASVTVTCAAKNALLSASEPSTCAYHLHFESPAACTPKYAELSGIPSLATE
jgi:protein kinase C substrate 80K-H